MKTKLKLVPFIIILIGVSIYFYSSEKQSANPFKYTGNVEGKEISITTEVAGELIGISNKEGDHINKGDIIFDIDVTDYDIKLKQLEIQEDIARLNYNQILDGASNDDVDLAVSNKNSVEKELAGAESNYNHLKDKYNDLLELFDSGTVSKSDLDNAKLQMDRAYSTMKSIGDKVQGAQAALDKVLSGAEKETIEIAKAQMDLRALEIEDLQNKIEKSHKKSPVSGTIQTQNYEIGEYINPGMAVMSIINTDKLTIDIFIQQQNLYKVNIGDKVIITEDFLDDKEVLGTIVSISAKAEFTPKNVESKESKQEMVYRTTIEVVKGQEFLKPGMFVDVEILSSKE